MQLQLLSGIDELAMREYAEVPYMSDSKTLQRIGILIGAKLDMYEMATRLRWGYLSKEDLGKKGLTEAQIATLKSELRKAEELYEAVGGSRVQFARAMLEGRGNADSKVKVDYTTLAGIDSPEELILAATPASLFASLQAQTYGLGSLDESGAGLNKASDILLKIGSMAQNVSTITTNLSSAVGAKSQTPANIYDTPEKKAGIGEWLSENKPVAASGILIALLGLAVTQMKIPKAEQGRATKKSKKRTASTVDAAQPDEPLYLFSDRPKDKGLSGVKRRASPRRASPRRTAGLKAIPLM